MMTGLALGTCDLALGPGAPEWVQLWPVGPVNGCRGRSWDLADPAALVVAFQSGGVDLPADFEHQNDPTEAKLKGPVPAEGWIMALRAGAGLWGRAQVDRDGG